MEIVPASFNWETDIELIPSTLYWSIDGKDGSVLLETTGSFMFGVRAAFSSLYRNEGYIKLPEYKDRNVIIKYTNDDTDSMSVAVEHSDDINDIITVTHNSPGSMPEVISESQLLNLYTSIIVTDEDVFTNIFSGFRIPPNMSVVSQNPPAPGVLLKESEECNSILELGERNNEGFTIIGIPAILSKNDFIRGFTYIHKQFILAHALRNGYSASSIPKELLTVIYLDKVPPTKLLTHYVYNGSVIEGLKILSRERLVY